MRGSADEVEHVALAILEKVFQGDTSKLGQARHIAAVAVRAHWEWGDEDGVWNAGSAVAAQPEGVSLWMLSLGSEVAPQDQQ